MFDPSRISPVSFKATTARYQGSSYPIFIAGLLGRPDDWLVALAGVDDQATPDSQAEINTWATAALSLMPLQLVQYDPYALSVIRAMSQMGMSRNSHAIVIGHSLGGIAAQSLAYYAATLQIVDWPRSRIVTVGSPVVNFPRLLDGRSPVNRLPGVSVSFFVANEDQVVSLAANAFPYRFIHAQVNRPPILNLFQGAGPDPHFSYHVTPALLDFDAIGYPISDDGKVLLLDPNKQYRCTTGSASAVSGYRQGQPGMAGQTSGCALVSMASLEQEVTTIRGMLPSDARRSGNVAVANLAIPGLPCFLAASSRIGQVTPAQGAAGLVGDADGRFATSRVSGIIVPPWMGREAAVDTENKILDAVAKLLDGHPGVRGNMQLYTERPPCTSCSSVISRFSIAYPHISLMVLDNGGR